MKGEKMLRSFAGAAGKKGVQGVFLVKAPALALQRKMSEQRRVLAGLGEDVERKKEVRKLF